MEGEEIRVEEDGDAETSLESKLGELGTLRPTRRTTVGSSNACGIIGLDSILRETIQSK